MSSLWTPGGEHPVSAGPGATVVGAVSSTEGEKIPARPLTEEEAETLADAAAVALSSLRRPGLV